MVWEYIRTDTIAPLSTLISVMFSCHVLQFVMFSNRYYIKRWQVTTHTHTKFNYTMNSAPQHHPPMPPTKATMGAITQNRRGHPTATP